jgi:hypothetical protein
MAVYVDELRVYQNAWGPFKNGSCHLTADSLEELHELAGRIGLKRSWFQNKSVPHYDLTKSKREAALAAGAVFVEARAQAQRRIAARAASKPSQ